MKAAGGSTTGMQTEPSICAFLADEHAFSGFRSIQKQLRTPTSKPLETWRVLVA
jgi:hypothetical protein